jgi:DNA-binding CsgD family transcriptional regulator
VSNCSNMAALPVTVDPGQRDSCPDNPTVDGVARAHREVSNLEHEIISALDCIHLSAPRAFPGVLPRIRQLLSAERAVAYSLRPGEGCRWFHADGPDAARARAAFPRFLDSHSSGWQGISYDPRHPEASQRNRARLHLAGTGSRDDIRRYFETCPETARVFGEAKLEMDHVRVLACDGPAVLAWVGAYREEPFSEREQRLLQRLVPSLRRRLSVEHVLDDAAAFPQTLDAALEAIGSPAFLLRRGRPVHANSAGRALLERDGTATMERLARATSSGSADDVQCTPVLSPGGGPDRVAVLRAGRADPAPRAAAAAVRFRLSSRETEVLAELSGGRSNKEIADALGCAEGTVELHVRSLLRKTGCTARTRLVALFWTIL